MLYGLVRSLRRTGKRLLDVIDGGARQKQRAMRKAQQRQAWRETARTRYQENAAALQSDAQILCHLEETIAARIGTSVRHVASEAVVRCGTGIRAHAYRRSYSKHWFEVSGTVDEQMMRLLDTNRLLVVFVKSASKLELCAPLEFILSDQGGRGFRAPYFFGSFTIGNLKIGAWEAIDTPSLPFAEYTLEDQTRIVEAIAAANAVRADRAVPVVTKGVNIEPRWFDVKYSDMSGKAYDLWRELHARTADVMRHRETLVRRLEAGGESFLTHNDLRVGGNITVPSTGDVLLFDWELASLSPPGADLGGLSGTDSGDHLLSCYVTKMAQCGFKLDAAAVRFTRDVIEGFRSIRIGWRNQHPRRVERGLALLASHLD